MLGWAQKSTTCWCRAPRASAVPVADMIRCFIHCLVDFRVDNPLLLGTSLRPGESLLHARVSPAARCFVGYNAGLEREDVHFLILLERLAQQVFKKAAVVGADFADAESSRRILCHATILHLGAAPRQPNWTERGPFEVPGLSEPLC